MRCKGWQDVASNCLIFLVLNFTHRNLHIQRAQIGLACRQAGISCEPGDITGTLICRFDDAAELIAWHGMRRLRHTCLNSMTGRFGWAPMAVEIAVREEQAEGRRMR